MEKLIIIGAGPAGISAALYAARGNLDPLVLNYGPGALEKAEKIENYYGLEQPLSGQELYERGLEQARNLGVRILEAQVLGMGGFDTFEVHTTEGTFEAESVILATGGKRKTPSIPGIKELEGKGVSYCATCDAPLYRGRTVAVIGFGQKEEEEAAFLAEVAEKVYYFPMYKGDIHAAVTVVREKPEAILGEEKVQSVRTAAREYPVDGVFVLRESILPEHLLKGLQLEGNRVVVNLNMETNIPGCFACGDLAGKPYQYIKAAGQGNVAALSAVEYLAKKKNS